jgi:hypothetical protein
MSRFSYGKGANECSLLARMAICLFLSKKVHENLKNFIKGIAF